jgi:hypothetical protein
MCIKSILDTDVYKFSTSWAYMKLYPEAEGTFEFCDRDNTQYDQKFLEMIKEEFENHKCKCKENSYEVEINYEYIDDIDEIKEIKKIGISDLTNIYTSIKINLKCNKCNKKEKDYLKNEFK